MGHQAVGRILEATVFGLATRTSSLTVKLQSQLDRHSSPWVLAALLVALLVPAPDPAAADEAVQEPRATRNAVMLPLYDDINPLSGALLQRRFQQAVEAGAEVIILDIHSPGGFTSVTFELMDMVLDADEVETVAFIEKDAISGAALLALACDQIVMLPGARLGDAGEIVMGADGAFRYTEAKSRSALAQKVRDTAQATGRPPALAEKMVDKDLLVFEATHRTSGQTRYVSDREWEALPDADQWTRGKPVREAGKEMFLILNGQRAVELGIADRTIANRDQLAETLHVREPIPVREPSWVDTLVLVLNSGVVTFLLITIGLIALTIELGAPGFGIGGLVSLLCFSLFFWSRFLGGTAGWLEVTLFLVGLVFIATELFVIPGFGVAGVSGITLVIGSLVMASRRVLIPENSEQLTSLGYDVLTVVGALVGFLIAVLFLSNYIGDIPGLSRLTLKPPLATDGGTTASEAGQGDETMLPGWQRVRVGDLGQAVSPLRPSGKVQAGQCIVDVVTEGDFVEAGSRVQVVTKQGSRIVVRPV
jgi:membrane-bound serine protease (ClpP class)